MIPMNNKHSFFSIQFNISSKFYDRLILTNQISIEKIEKKSKNGFRRQFRDSDCKGGVRLNDSRLDNAATEMSNDNATG